MTRYLLDTNHLGESLAAVSKVRDRMRQLRRSGGVFGTIAPALCELLAGVIRTKDAVARRRRLSEMLFDVRVWPIELPVVERYALFFNRLRDAGRSLSQIDIMIAATASVLNATILTTDRDFEALPEIPTENWLAVST